MLDDFQPAVRFAIMSILSALYESGLVEEVELGDVLRLFGVEATPVNVTRISFREQGWIDAYIDFREEVDKMEEVQFEFDPDSETAEEDLAAIIDLAEWEPNGKSN